ncbi:MAG: CpaF/VirB11 family protein [Oscillospiraceae bacterium]|nr:CpaF/VirB11 family protein [Oscillospiraceae bacterium]
MKSSNNKPLFERKNRAESETQTVRKKLITFPMLLSETQAYVAKHYASTLYESDKSEMVKQYIKQYVIDNNYYVDGCILSDVVDSIYIEMAEYSFLTPYLKSKEIEELNINAWDDIAVHPIGGKPFKLQEHFSSPQHAIDIMRRLLHNNKLVFDESRPIVTGYLDGNIRITATHPIVVGEHIGVSASIRIVNPQKITREQFIESDTCTADMHSFLKDCFIYGISQCYAGGTGSGKTTFMADIMSFYPDHKRLITIEKSVREFDLRKFDENGNVINNVIHMVTRDSDDPNRNVTIMNLLTAGLTMHPEGLVVAEMKNEESWEAQEASRTGHTVLTTTHASSTQGIYTRLATLCLQKYSNVPFPIIIRLVCEAFPIAIFMKQLEDGKRHLMEIAECSYRDGDQYDIRPLWTYEVRNQYRDDVGKVCIDGGFVRRNVVSDGLKKRLLENGMPQNLVNKYANDGKEGVINVS